MMNKVKDLTTGTDIRGDEALFIEAVHIDGWELDTEAQEAVGNSLHFFRVLDNGEQTRSHGWIENGRIIQWG